jgi:hypothetical protein
MEAVSISETSDNFYETAWRNIPEQQQQQQHYPHRRKKLKSYIYNKK